MGAHKMAQLECETCGGTFVARVANRQRFCSRDCSNIRYRKPDDEVSYARAHKRIREARGPARTHQCAQCDAPAAEWSYDHSDPEERTSEIGPYSLDLERYRPLCLPCHRKQDAPSPPTHCRNGHEYTPENTMQSPGWPRQCRTCSRASARRYYERQKAVA